MRLELKPPRAEDYDFCRLLHHVTMKPLCLEYFEWQEDDQDRRFRVVYREDEARIIFAGGKRAGWLQARRTPGNLNLGQLYVEEQYRGGGIGTEIIKGMIGEARKGNASLTLGVLKNNPARRLYERMGFEIIGENEYKYFMTHGADRTGLFITFEGGEGSGKTTQIKLLAECLKAKGLDVVTTREPGGTPEAEKIRSLLVNRDGGDWTPVAEVLLLFAARSMHVEKLIKPALAAGKVVISDRFTDSTRAYQSYGHGLPAETVENINKITLGNFAPGLTFILDLPVETGLSRAGKRLAQDASKEDRFEKLKTDFHERLRQGYLDIARKNPQRCVVIDATQPIDALAAEIAEKAVAHLERAKK